MEDDTDTETYYDQEGPIGQGVKLEDACPHDLDSEPVNKKEVMNIEEKEELNISRTTRKRGTVYCRKLTMLPPGEKLNVEFDEDEKSSFDDPEYRRESVMKHAQRLSRGARSKLKRKYFNDIRLKTKEEHLKISLEKSKKASETRAHQNMTHYYGTKSFARLRQEIRQKNEEKRSQVDVLVASRTRKSKKVVNALTLEKNTIAVDEIKKLKEQRDQGLNDKTDEQIFQDVLGKDIHGYLRAYGPELTEVKKKADQLIEETRKDAENAKNGS
ncbi:Dystrophin [Bienertia sinuspersici]